ncbi:heme peroxidase [Tomitella fengzijianii]|uniref:Heme peroxidase n=1 Tax=Tomitella fengzijianii TaxID=2597660 RepID=A0A516X2F4_9ACTN|nr:heme peroxidase [Tomitella fengzijianii]QDQ97262.1 heme peroxidase [Tomitella fengzijianii]
MTNSADNTDSLDAFVKAVRVRLGDPHTWTRHDRFHGSLALCIIDAVQSTAAEYDKSVLTVDRYRAYRRAQGVDDVVDGARDLLRTFEQVGGSLVWSGKVGRYKMPYGDANAVRAMAIQDTAERLRALGVDTVEDLRAATADPGRHHAIRDAWLAASSTTDEVNWTYLLMLAGAPGILPGSLTSAFAADALGVAHASDAPGPRQVHALVAAAADAVETTPVELEHAVWRWELNRAAPAAIPLASTAPLAAA